MEWLINLRFYQLWIIILASSFGRITFFVAEDERYSSTTYGDHPFFVETDILQYSEICGGWFLIQKLKMLEGILIHDNKVNDIIGQILGHKESILVKE